MNLHQSKGLEARVVVLASPAGGSALRADFRVERRSQPGGRARGYFSIRNRYQLFAQPLDWREHEAAELGFLAEEHTRLRYVAATRARETLVVSRWTGTHASAQRPWFEFEKFLDEAQELDYRGVSEPCSPPSPREGIEAARQRWSEERHHIRQPSWSRTSVTASNQGAALQAHPTPPPAELLQNERQDAGTLWGDLIHRLLERLMRDPSLTQAQLERLARWFIFDHPELGELVPRAVETVESLKETELWERVTAAKVRLVEVPFGVRSPSDPTRLVFGVLDLVLQTTEAWEIIDYKTDRKQLEELVTRYAGQVEEYARHWANLAGEPVAYAGLYGVREGKLSQDVR